MLRSIWAAEPIATSHLLRIYHVFRPRTANIDYTLYPVFFDYFFRLHFLINSRVFVWL